jgi:hypothetical protein
LLDELVLKEAISRLSLSSEAVWPRERASAPIVVLEVTGQVKMKKDGDNNDSNNDSDVVPGRASLRCTMPVPCVGVHLTSRCSEAVSLQE